MQQHRVYRCISSVLKGNQYGRP
ncbi:Bgt-50285 [Blumeria graminis f. sp. tritici]|uniref:Bgt-50285 n=1 Tax=Blumeria graminis f. sp. tritici TaxID=62690 RepID=A0A9X9MIX0_BLUGR|nr:Bgt-50285 [Blumeria graminis f. sp. tritici]